MNGRTDGNKSTDFDKLEESGGLQSVSSKIIASLNLNEYEYYICINMYSAILRAANVPEQDEQILR